jgi:hypothetical protein
VGPGQDRIDALMTEFDVSSYKQYADGEAMMLIDGKRYRLQAFWWGTGLAGSAAPGRRLGCMRIGRSFLTAAAGLLSELVRVRRSWLPAQNLAGWVGVLACD